MSAMKHMNYLTISVLALTLTACGGKKETALPAATVDLRITAEVPAGVKADRITVIPNDVAPWVSQILLLSGQSLYRTSAGGGKAQSVSVSNLMDILGLMRAGAAGTALGLTQDGKLTALIEKDDDGRLARMNVSSDTANYDGFCNNAKAPLDAVIAFSGKDLITLRISYEGNDVMSVSETTRLSLPKDISSCYASGDQIYAIAGGGLFSNEQALGSVPEGAQNLTAIAGVSAPTLLYTDNSGTLSTLRAAQPDTRRKIAIKDGLSVIGTEHMSAVFATADSLGGTFSEGAIIAQDSKSERLILVALPFAERTLAKQDAAAP